MVTLIKNGTLVTPVSMESTNVVIDGKIIKYTGKTFPEAAADKIIDATGCFLLPGGVDPHVHMHLPWVGGYSADDFHSGSRAALFGGTTTLIDFVTPSRGESLTEALEKRKKEAEGSLTDYSFHVSPVEWRKSTAEEIRECIRMGMTSFKIYMAYKATIGLDDNTIRKVLQAVAREGGIVTVHCELGDDIEMLRTLFYDENKREPLYHALSRPSDYESKAVKKIIAMAGNAGCPLYIVHVSAYDSLEYIENAKAVNQKVYAETCPQYLLLDDTCYRSEFTESAPYVISPPLRSSFDIELMWEAVAGGTIDTIGTDHCPFTMADKLTGKNDFRKIPNGAGGVEHRLQLLYTYGVCMKSITLNRLVDLYSAQPARIFGLYPGKGTIEPGSDADIVIWDPAAEGVISSSTHHQNCDINIYEGFRVKGAARYVIAGGKIAVNNGVMTTEVLAGNFLTR
jgi:dihydropyrimidinase